MKKLTLVIMTIALLLGMAQCKKSNEVITNAGSTHEITLNVSDNGSKVNVDPTTGDVTFQTGDVIYAAYNGKFAGTLTYKGSNFTGSISTTGSEGAKLAFYFLGNKTPQEALSYDATSLTVSIFDQTSELPVISAGLSNEKYSSSESNYSATLENKCGLVKFNVTTSSSAPTIITGVKDQVIFAFSANSIGTITNSEYIGAIKLGTGDGEKWTILLPQDATSGSLAYSDDLQYGGTCGTIPNITNNGYSALGIEVDVTTTNKGFTVAAGRTVRFAKGNLQYKCSTDKFRFAAHQYDYVGNAVGNTDPSNSQTAWIDLFGWGTSGYNDKYPYMTSTINSDYGDGNNNISGTNYDWGVYNRQDSQNKIEGFGDHAWRTLTNDEWGYVFNNSDRGANRYLKANITVGDNNYNGVILFPDNYDGSIGSYTYNNTEGYTSVSEENWTAMELAGAVFLPAAARRSGTTIYYPGSYGFYWSATYYNSDHACRVFFNDSNFVPQHNDNRNYGCSVRLVF